MTQDEFRTSLATLQLSYVELAGLLDVTDRAVGMWASGDRPVPGPVAAYLRVLDALPLELRLIELHRIRGGQMLQEGMYGLELKTQIGGYGVGSLVLKGGKIYGVDSGGVSYDGLYRHENGMVDATIHVQFPPNTQSVTGITRPNSWGFDVDLQFPASAGGFIGSVRTPDGPVQAKLTFMRPIPN